MMFAWTDYSPRGWNFWNFLGTFFFVENILMVFECLYFMHLCFHFRFLFGWMGIHVKLRLHYKREIAKSPYWFYLVDGNADGRPTSMRILGTFYFKFWTSIFGEEMVAFWIFILLWIDIQDKILLQEKIPKTSILFRYWTKMQTRA